MKPLLPAFAMAWFSWLAALAAPPAMGDTTIHHLADDRRVIIERVAPIQLPDPPEPIVRPEPEPKTAAQLALLAAAWRADRDANPTIHAGATVYRLPDGTTVTHVNQFRVNSGPLLSFWSSADFSLLAHPGSFASPDGAINYSMLLLWTPHDIAHWSRFMADRRIDYQTPEIPTLAEGPATWLMEKSPEGEEIDAATEAAIQHLHSHVNQHLAELQQAYATLEATRAARRAELEANPPQPRDIHLRVSRLTKAQAAAWHQHANSRNGGAK